MTGFSFKRFLAVLRKEWIQVRRDPFTLRMIIVLPVMQLFLFGYAINADPKHLPTGLLSADHSKYERTILAALKNTGYYDIRELTSEAEAERGLADGELLFVVNIPANFARSVDRGEKPAILMDADATDPSAIGNAAAALASLTTALDRDLPPSVQSKPASLPLSKGQASNLARCEFGRHDAFDRLSRNDILRRPQYLCDIKFEKRNWRR